MAVVLGIVVAVVAEAVSVMSDLCRATATTLLKLLGPAIDDGMQMAVLIRRQYGQILGTVVRSIVVAMMDVLSALQWPAEDVLGDHAMLVDPAAVWSQQPDIAAVTAAAFPLWGECATSRISTALHGAVLTLTPNLACMAMSAISRDGHGVSWPVKPILHHKEVAYGCFI
jgi:hypothetical protein